MSRRRPGTSARPDEAVFVAFLGVLVWLPLPWGSNTDAGRALLGVLAAVLMALGLVRTRRYAPGRLTLPGATRFAFAIWILWLAWTLAQIVPLGPEWLEILSPQALAAHIAVAEIPGASPLYTLSILPGATVDQVLLGFGYFCLFWLTIHLVHRDRRRQRIVLVVIVASGVFQALYGALMTLSGLEYGFFEVNAAGKGVATGTFVNRNHYAAYLGLALSAGTALVLADLRPIRIEGWRERLAALLEAALSRRMRFRIMLVVMVVALVLTRSRMGNVAFFTALTVMGGIYILLRHRELFVRSLLLFASMLVIDLMIVSEHFGLEQLAERIERTDIEAEQRTIVVEELKPLLDHYRWTGSGLGTFAAAYSPVRSPQVLGYFDHAHNDHLEFLIEAGIIGYALLAALAATVLLHGLLTVLRRHDSRACALGFVGPMALLCLGVHGLADFNLRIPAVAGTLVVLIGLTLSCSSRSRRNGDRGSGDPGEDRPGAAGAADPA